MTLVDVIRDLSSLDKEATIYAAEPWTEDLQAIVAPAPEAGGLPPQAQELGLTYFLEVVVASDFLEGWQGGLESEPTAQQRVTRLIQYATTDA